LGALADSRLCLDGHIGVAETKTALMVAESWLMQRVASGSAPVCQTAGGSGQRGSQSLRTSGKGCGRGRTNLGPPTAASGIGALRYDTTAVRYRTLSDLLNHALSLCHRLNECVGGFASLPGRQFLCRWDGFLLTFLVLQYRAVPIALRVGDATPINIGSFECSVNSTPTPGTFDYGPKKSSVSVSG
jgi:hypothetical protein